MRKKIVLIGFSILIISLLLQKLFLNGFDNNFYNGIVVNAIIETISVVVTVTLINALLKKEEKEKYDNLIKNTLRNQLIKLYSELSGVYINFVQKEPLKHGSEGPDIKNNNEAIQRIIKNIDDYVNDEFTEKNIKTFIANPEYPMRKAPEEKVISYQKFCYYFFKPKFQNLIDNYMQKYFKILPTDLMITIYKMENSIKDFSFVTIYEASGKEEEMKVSEDDLENIKKHLLIIAKSLNHLYELVKRTK